MTIWTKYICAAIPAEKPAAISIKDDFSFYINSITINLCRISCKKGDLTFYISFQVILFNINSIDVIKFIYIP